MALQIWLPLTGDLHNQGLNGQAKVTNYNVEINNSGKIGKCGSFNGTNAYLQFSGLNMDSWANFTIAFWCYTTVSLAGIFLIRQSQQHQFNISATGINFRDTKHSSSLVNLQFDQPELEKWTHCAIVYKNGSFYVYHNGIKIFEQIYANSATLNTGLNEIRIGRAQSTSGNTYYNGKINDIRIYDHALSPKEVEEIAKGLVLHYELNDRFCEATTNLYSTLDGVSTSCYNGSNGKYGYGSNSNVYKTTGIFNERQSLKIYMGTSGSSARPYPYFSNLFTSDGTNAPAYKTLSFDYYGTIGTYLNFYKLGSGSGTGNWKNITNNTSGSFTNSGSITVTTNKWQHIELTLHGTTNANAEWGYCILGDAHTSNTSNYWLFANIQLETKDHATGFAGYGATRTPTTIYDSSGYSNNGTISGTLTAVAPSARYDVATYISSGNTNYITSPTMYLPGDKITMNFWFKSSNKSPGSNYHMPLEGNASSNQSYEMSITSSGVLRGGLVVAGSRKVDNCTSSKLTDGNWHMCTMTYDGATIKRYVDAVMEKSTAATGALVTSTQFVLGHYGSNTSYYCKEAYISDVRIYTTALTDGTNNTVNQIKELYDTSMSIDSSGNVHARELVER